jgi:hypothetical protein
LKSDQKSESHAGRPPSVWAASQPANRRAASDDERHCGSTKSRSAGTRERVAGRSTDRTTALLAANCAQPQAAAARSPFLKLLSPACRSHLGAASSSARRTRCSSSEWLARSSADRDRGAVCDPRLESIQSDKINFAASSFVFSSRRRERRAGGARDPHHSLPVEETCKCGVSACCVALAARRTWKNCRHP